MAIKTLIRSALGSSDFEEGLAKLALPPEKMINPLLSALFATDELVRWRAVRAVGWTVSRMADQSPESARNIMRRLIWSLNDESGGIGWGAPEAMGEIMALNGMLACEYHCILISYIDENGNLLENDELERGVLWGIGRLADARPELVQGWVEPVAKQLHSPDPVKRGMAAWALGYLKPEIGRIRQGLSSLLSDETEVRIYQGGEIRRHKICDLASELLSRVSQALGTDNSWS
jgi:HEAT repeat protein